MTKKLTDKAKLERVKRNIELSLWEVENTPGKAVKLNSIIRNLCFAYAVIQTEEDDDMLITHLGGELYRHVTKSPLPQLILPKFSPEDNHEPKSKDPKK